MLRFVLQSYLLGSLDAASHLFFEIGLNVQSAHLCPASIVRGGAVKVRLVGR